jgi:feruloyl esterase
MKIASLAGGLLLGGYVALQAQADAFVPADCTIERLQGKAPKGTTITAASLVDATDRVPAHCRVDGHTASPGNTVNFRLGLPVRWNGKFYFQGVGGLAGTIGSLNTGLVRGYASASTDTGHAADDPTWGQNRAKEIDYGHRGTHVATVATKALAASAYGRPLQQSYFNGCSNGGRQALMEVQRYPEDFTGIIAGDPAMGTPMQVGRALVYQHMLKSAANYLPSDKVELISKASLAECDAKDGLADGLITDPRRCTFKQVRWA